VIAPTPTIDSIMISTITTTITTITITTTILLEDT
jgi:hypothetical protein